MLEYIRKTLMGATADEIQFIFLKLSVSIIEIHFFFIERNKQNERKTVQIWFPILSMGCGTRK